MAKRHWDAWHIQQGACNPSGIAHSIVEACKEIREDPSYSTDQIRADPAVRLMVYQLAAICGMEPLDWGLSDAFDAAMKECEKRKDEN